MTEGEAWQEEEDWQTVEREMASAIGQGFYKPHLLEQGKAEVITVMSATRWAQTKFPIKDKAGNSLGYTWRFRLSDGRVWDVSNANRRELLRGLHPEDPKVTVPGRFQVTNLGASVNKRPATKVEYLGVAEKA